MINRAYINLVWRNNRIFTLFSAAFITLFQFMILYLATTFDTAAILSAILDQLPPMIKAFLNDSFFSMLSYDGAAAFGLSHPIVTTLLVTNTINIPTHHISRELESGTLELLLAHPYRRSSLILSLWTSGALIILFIVIMALTGSFVSIFMFHELTAIVLVRLFEISLNLWLLMMLIFSYTMLIAVYGKTGFKAGNMSAAITFFFYLLSFLAQIWSAISFTNYFNIFNYYQPQKLMFGKGEFLRDILVLFFIIIILLGLSLRRFGKRDLP